METSTQECINAVPHRSGSKTDDFDTTAVIFDVAHLYYLPQYLPIYTVMRQQFGVQARFLLYKHPENSPDNSRLNQILHQTAISENLPCIWVDSEQQALEQYQKHQPRWIIFGNRYKHLDKLPPSIHTAMVNHGAGVKSAGQNPNMCQFDVRFAEGPYQLSKLRQNYPQGHYVDVGFSKLDPFFQSSPPGNYAKDINALGLDPLKKTLLYAPTFFPSSIEAMADDWPKTFAQYNLLVKPHFFTYTKAKYQKQRHKLATWSRAANVYIADISEFSLLPFFACADLMISDASTALFEFAALNKPLVWCDFLKLRWSYRGPFKYRFKKRMDQDINRFNDIAQHAQKYTDLLPCVQQQLENPQEYAARRQQYTKQLLGKTDGKVSYRIAHYLLKEFTQRQSQ